MNSLRGQELTWSVFWVDNGHADTGGGEISVSLDNWNRSPRTGTRLRKKRKLRYALI